MNNGKVEWKGNFVAVATPFDKDGRIDEQSYVKNIRNMLDDGADGIVVAGCTGEAWSLTDEERASLLALARKELPSGKVLIGGTGTIDVNRVIGMSRDAVRAGCDGVLVMPPYYAVIGKREIKEFYRAVSDEVQAPIMLYNMPKRTGINMSPEFLSELCDLEWIVAMKQSSNDFTELETTIAQCGSKIEVFAGHSAERGLSALVMGCPGFVSSLEAHVMGAEAVGLYHLATKGNFDKGRKVQQKTVALDKAMRAIGTFPANMKAAMNILGKPGGYSRKPLLDLDAEQIRQVSASLDQLAIL